MQPPPPFSMLPPRPRTFVKRGAYMVCSDCSLAVQYCRCGELPAPDPGSNDAAESSLAARVAACKDRR